MFRKLAVFTFFLLLAYNFRIVVNKHCVQILPNSAVKRFYKLNPQNARKFSKLSEVDQSSKVTRTLKLIRYVNPSFQNTKIIKIRRNPMNGLIRKLRLRILISPLRMPWSMRKVKRVRLSVPLIQPLIQKPGIRNLIRIKQGKRNCPVRIAIMKRMKI